MSSRSEHTRQQAARAYTRRRALILELGGVCSSCGDDEERSGFSMEFDHPNGRDWTPSKLNRWQRQKLYERDAAMGLLRLLCRRCNARDGRRFRWPRGKNV